MIPNRIQLRADRGPIRQKFGSVFVFGYHVLGTLNPSTFLGCPPRTLIVTRVQECDITDQVFVFLEYMCPCHAIYHNCIRQWGTLRKFEEAWRDPPSES